MTKQFRFIIPFLIIAVLLSACGPVTSETGPGVNEPTIEESTAVPETAVPATLEPTPTAEIIEEPTPTVEIVEPAPTDEPAPTAEPEVEATGLCPDVARPAMVLFIQEGYTLFDPVSGSSCELDFGENAIGGALAVAGSNYYVNTHTTGAEGQATIVRRVSQDGTVEELPYTLVDTAHGSTLTGFAVSPNDQYIAWGVIGQPVDGAFPGSSLGVTDLESGQTKGFVGSDIEEPRALQPIRFSDDGSILYYALQPYGIGGSWQAFVGRYDNLYAVHTDTMTDPELLFDCADTGTGLCIGDFLVQNNTLSALAYVDNNEKAVVVLNGEGTELNRLTTEEEYIGYPIWSADGELIYYTANIDDETDGPPMPESGSLYRVAPPTGPAEKFYSESGLLPPLRFLSNSQIITQWLGEEFSWGLALLSTDGTIQEFDILTGASLIAIAE